MIHYKLTQKAIKKADIILPLKKGKLKSLEKFTNVNNPDFEGDFSEQRTIYNSDGTKLYLLGLGEEKHGTKLSEAFRKLYFDCKKQWSNTIQVYCDDLNDSEIAQLVLGFEMATYEIGKYKSKLQEAKPLDVLIFSKKASPECVVESKFTGETINNIKTLVDAPANVKTPEYLGKWAQASAKTTGYKCTVLHESELKKQGFEAVLAVGRASANPPVVIVSEYMPKKSKKVDIGLVGKGITFDTGGLSIKSSTNLHYMKSDMGGAAAVLGTVELVAKLKLDINVVGIVASAENAVGRDSYRPSDVIGSYSGKTIEIIDTDAEGRLVLADGLSYLIKKFNPSQVIDLATLTGSVVQTLGYTAAGMFTNDNAMASKMSKVGTAANERVWQLPMFEDFDADLHSDVADIRNFSGKPIAGAITAAKFLEAFTENHSHWMHLDIAGVAFGDSAYAKMKSATGFGVRLLTDYIKSHCKK